MMSISSPVSSRDILSPASQFAPVQGVPGPMSQLSMRTPTPIIRPTAVCKMPNCHGQQQQQQHQAQQHCTFSSNHQMSVPAPMSPISEHSTTVSTSQAESSVTMSCAAAAPPPGFNSSCQQCLAERAAADGTLGETSSVKGGEAQQQQQHQSMDSSGIEFPSMPSDDTLEAFQALEETRGHRLSEPGPGRTYECEMWCRETSRLVAGCLGICCLAIGYAAIGGFLFMAIETRAARTSLGLAGGSSEDQERSEALEAPTVMNVTTALLEMPKEVRNNLEKARNETVTKLWIATEKMNILYPDNWTRRAAEEILWFQDQLTKAFAQEFHSWKTQASQMNHRELAAAPEAPPVVPKPKEWTFSRGLLYSVSLLTTVGNKTYPAFEISINMVSSPSPIQHIK